CINQKEPEEFHRRIQQMDAIYSNSLLTTFAVAGTDSYYGLPGVGRSRREQQSKKVGDHSFLAVPRYPKYLIVTSRGISSGCAYQEALLSRRTLVFTEKQLYLESQGVYCKE
ncbi:hypothetical protein K469DRAFT_538289, partial [Zopfia rhizophila CBS 207.26]